jgi:hypothetical protein
MYAVLFKVLTQSIWMIQRLKTAWLAWLGWGGLFIVKLFNSKDSVKIPRVPTEPGWAAMNSLT